MSADLNTSISIDKQNGKDIITKVLHTMKPFEDRNNNKAYLERLTIKEDKKNVEELRLSEMDNDEINEFVSKLEEDLSIDSIGPYGNYQSLLETGIFQKIADIDPKIKFKGIINGFDGSGHLSLEADMHEGLLYLTEYKETIFDQDEHVSFIAKLINYSTFCKLFEIEKEDYEKEDYLDFLPEFIERISPYPSFELDEFIDYFDTEINKEKYNRIVEQLSTIEAMNFETFNDLYNLKARIQYYVYDPNTHTIELDNERKEKMNTIKKEQTEKTTKEIKEFIKSLNN